MTATTTGPRGPGSRPPGHRRSGTAGSRFSGTAASRLPGPARLGGGLGDAPSPARPVLPSMDPRIRQRRIAVRRGQGRRRLHLLVSGLGVVATGAALAAVLHSPLLAVRTVQVTGAAHVTRAQVLAAARLGPATPMIDVNAGAAQASLRRLPWVATASVSRHWPATIRVRLTERVPVAEGPADGGGWAALDRSGRVLAVSASRWPGLVTLGGIRPLGRPGTAVAADRPALAVAAALSPAVRAEVSSVSLMAGGNVELALVPQGTVELGSTSQLPAKLASLSAVLAQVDLSNVAVIDVEVPQAPTLTRR